MTSRRNRCVPLKCCRHKHKKSSLTPFTHFIFKFNALKWHPVDPSEGREDWRPVQPICHWHLQPASQGLHRPRRSLALKAPALSVSLLSSLQASTQSSPSPAAPPDSEVGLLLSASPCDDLCHFVHVGFFSSMAFISELSVGTITATNAVTELYVFPDDPIMAVATRPPCFTLAFCSSSIPPTARQSTILDCIVSSKWNYQPAI